MTAAPALRLGELTLAELPCDTRLPFRFGAVTVTAAPLLHARVEIATADGGHATGMAADLLVPKWFRKDVERDAAADQAALRASVAAAAERFRAAGSATVFELWQRVQRELVEDEPATTPDLLERGFGIALLERALIDAMCRHAGAGFAEARRSGLLGREFDWPATRPRQRIAVRHTVGRLDPLRSSDIAPAERVADGMPQALDEVLEQHGVRWLKVKIGGGLTDDVARLVEIGLLLGELGRDDVRVTLDGNEQFADFEELDRLWVETAANPHGEGLLRRVLWVEQPLPRARSLGDGAARWQRCPLVLDEADAQRRTFEQSGCDGVSVKNCKGVFRALLNAELASKQPGRFQSSEDLTNLPVLSVQQDLVTAAVLDLPHSERNGHHYFPGLDHLPPAVVEAALAAHGDLYVATDSGAKLRIEGGEIAIGSLFGTGYGCDQSVVDALDRALDWRPA